MTETYTDLDTGKTVDADTLESAVQAMYGDHHTRHYVRPRTGEDGSLVWCTCVYPLNADGPSVGMLWWPREDAK